MVLVRLFLSFVFLVSKSCEALGLARLGFCIFFDFPFFLFSPAYIHGSWSRSSVLRIGSNPTEASSLGRTGGESDSLALVVHRVAPEEPPFPLGKGKINEIRYPSGFEYLRAAIQNAEAVGPN